MKVFTFGTPAIKDGERVEVRGIFQRVKQVGAYTFHDEIDASSVSAASRGDQGERAPRRRVGDCYEKSLQVLKGHSGGSMAASGSPDVRIAAEGAKSVDHDGAEPLVFLARVPKPLKRHLAIYCAEQGVAVQQFVAEAIREALGAKRRLSALTAP